MIIFRDFFLALRTLGRSVGFSLLVILVMSVGLGAIAAVFSIANEMILRPYPFPGAERTLVIRGAYTTTTSHFGVSRLDFEDLRSSTRLFEDMAAVHLATLNLTGPARPVAVRVGFTSPNLFDLTGPQPLIGRTFDPDATQLDGQAVLDEEFWRVHLAGDRGVVGRSIQINSKPYEIIGVAPASHRFPDETEIWVPHRVDASATGRNVRNKLILARMQEGATREQVAGELSAISDQLAQTFPESNKNWSLKASTLSDFRLGPWADMLTILGVLATFVMLISCGNVSILLLERTLARQRQLAIRSALGAVRRQLVQTVLAESVILSVLGGLLGLGFAHYFLRLIVVSLPRRLSANLHFSIDWRVFAVVFLAALAAAMLAGLLPALRASRLRLVDSLKEGGGLAQGRGRQRLRSAMAVAQISVSFLLLIAAGLLVRSFLQLHAYDPGHRLDDVVLTTLVLPSDPYSDAERRVALYDELLEKTRSQPGIEAAGAGSSVPFSSWDRSYLKIEDGSAVRDDLDILTGVQRVSVGYFETLEMPLLEGRLFEEHDDAETEPVAIINQTLAKQLWGGGALGQRIWAASDKEWRTVIGIVGDVERVGFTATGEFDYYIPYRQSPRGTMRLFVRSPVESSMVMPQTRRLVAETDPDIPIDRIQPLNQALDELIAPQRVIGMMLSIFGFSALLLATAGLYGFVSFYVTRRTQEIGLRMALGAKRAAVLWLVTWRMLVLAGLGVGIGLTASFGLTQSLRGFLYEISPLDGATYAAVVLLFVLVTGLALLGPLTRASRLSPSTALRDE